MAQKAHGAAKPPPTASAETRGCPSPISGSSRRRTTIKMWYRPQAAAGLARLGEEAVAPQGDRDWPATRDG